MVSGGGCREKKHIFHEKPFLSELGVAADEPIGCEIQLQSFYAITLFSVRRSLLEINAKNEIRHHPVYLWVNSQEREDVRVTCTDISIRKTAVGLSKWTARGESLF